MHHIRLVPIVAVVSAVLVLGACSRGGSTSIRSYALGEKAKVGNLIYTVYETQWVPQFGEGPTGRIPQHRFFLVRMATVNSGNAEVIVPNVTIEDDNGNSFPELKDGEGVPQWIGYLRQVKPAESSQGNLVFDAPPAHYKLRVTDEDEQTAAFVDIPLSFGSELPTPEVPMTGTKK